MLEYADIQGTALEELLTDFWDDSYDLKLIGCETSGKYMDIRMKTLMKTAQSRILCGNENSGSATAAGADVWFSRRTLRVLNLEKSYLPAA